MPSALYGTEGIFMAVAAEASLTFQLASEAYPHAELEARCKLTSFLGATAIRGETARIPDADIDNESTMLYSVQAAGLGDTISRQVIETNVRTDLGERLYKVAHQSRVAMKFEDGVLRQNSRSLTDIHRNTLRHMHLSPEMLRRTKIELKNAILFEELQKAGALEDNIVAVFSPTPTAMSLKEKRDYNFFLDTESCSIQMLKTEGQATYIETAMVAGKATPQSERHDIITITKLMQSYGLEVPEQDGTSLLQYVLLIPKSAVANGITDIVRLYDDAAGGTFYGQAMPRLNYNQYAQECEARNRSFDDTVERITDQLILEASNFTSPIDVIERLDYLSERYGVTHAIQDKTIDEAVFGRQAALHIQEARFFIEQGELGRADNSMRKAQATADSGSCPIFKSSKNEVSDNSDGNGAKGEESSGKKLMSCPYCSAKVFDDPCAKVLSCWDCSALVVNGKIKSKGDGGSKARAAAREAKRLQAEAEMAKQVDDTFAQIDVGAIEAEEKIRSSQHVARVALKTVSV